MPDSLSIEASCGYLTSQIGHPYAACLSLFRRRRRGKNLDDTPGAEVFTTVWVLYSVFRRPLRDNSADQMRRCKVVSRQGSAA